MAIGWQLPLEFELARERSASYHVLIEGDGFCVTGPDGRRARRFQVWRRVRAVSAAQAESVARAAVQRDWAGRCLVLLGAIPRLRVGAVARLGLLSAWAVRDTGYEFLAA